MLNIVVVGGGFGGIYTLIELLKNLSNNEVKITLFNKNNYFLFTPLLHEVATGGLNPTNVAEGIREIIKSPKVEFVEKMVDRIDLENKKVYACSKEIAYDYIVIATGSESNPKKIAGYERCFTLKDLSSAVKLKRAIIEKVQNSVLQKQELNISVIGAGSTGVELVCEIQELIFKEMSNYYGSQLYEHAKINLISPLGILKDEEQKVRDIAKQTIIGKNINLIANKRVISVDDNSITLEGGQKVQSDLTVYTGGVRANLPEMTPNSAVLDNGKLSVNSFMHIKDFETAYALGDCAHLMQDDNPIPMLAQAAVNEAKIVGKNIAAKIKGEKEIQFNYKHKGTIISLGQWNAVANIYGVIQKGKLVWWIWRTVYLFKFISPRKRFKIALDWTINLISPRDIVTY